MGIGRSRTENATVVDEANRTKDLETSETKEVRDYGQFLRDSWVGADKVAELLSRCIVPSHPEWEKSFRTALRITRGVVDEQRAVAKRNVDAEGGSTEHDRLLLDPKPRAVLMILYGLLAVEKAIVRSEADPITALRVRTAVVSLLFDEVKDIIRPMKTVTSEV